MSEFFWIYTLLVLIILVMSLVIRKRMMTWAWNFLLIALLLFGGLFKMTGMARDALFFSTIERMHGDIEVLYQGIVPKKSIYLLIREDPTQQPYYVTIAWTQQLEEQMKAAEMKAVEQQTPLLVNIDMLSKWRIPDPSPPGKGKAGRRDADGPKGNAEQQEYGQKEGGEMMFYPKPVTGDPNKNPTRSIIIEREGTQGTQGVENPE